MKPTLLKRLLLLLMLAVACSARAQWSPPPPLETVDLPAANSRIIVTGTLTSLGAADDRGRFPIEVAVHEVLKGTAGPTLSEKVRLSHFPPGLLTGPAKDDLLLVAISANDNEPATVIDLASKDLAVFTADLKLLRTPEAVIAAVKERVRATRDKPPVGRYERTVPVSMIAGTELEKRSYVSQDKTVRFYVPIDDRLEQFGLKQARTPGGEIDGMRVLRNFKTVESIDELRKLLRDGRWELGSAYDRNEFLVYQVNGVSREAFESLRSMGIEVPEPVTLKPTERWLQIQSADCGGQVGSDFLDRYVDCPNLIDLSFSGANLQPGAMEALAKIKTVQMLYFQASNITDRDLEALAALPNLLYLNLANTGVTDAGLLKLVRFKPLRKVDLGEGCSEDGIAALRRLRPDISVQPDEFAFLNTLHPRRIEMGFAGRSARPGHGTIPEVWRYGLLFPKETAAQVDAMLAKELPKRGWSAGCSNEQPIGGGYHRIAERLSGRAFLVENVVLPAQTDGQPAPMWGVSAEPGGRFVVIERITQ